MSVMNRMKVPELLQEIAAFVDNSRDLSAFAQVDRSAHAVVTPCIFRNIELRLDFVDSLAVAFRNDPARAALCSSLSFCSRYGERALIQDGDVLQKLYTDLIAVFGAVSVHRHLKTLKWNGWLFQGRVVQLSEGVGAAVSSVLGSLQEFEIYVRAKDSIWCALTRTRFSQLRVFRLYLCDVHSWDCAELQIMLDTLCHVEELALEFPTCCGPYGITLGSTYPISNDSRSPPANCFRNPNFCCDTRLWRASTSRLSSVNEGSLFASPTLVGPGSKITHLRFREIEEDRIQVLADMVRAVGRTLRCLELDVEGEEDGPIPRHATDLLSLAPALDELAIIRQRSTRRLPLNWSSNLLTDLLAALGLASPVCAVRLCCDEALPQSRLDDLGPLPPRLKYIGWDVHATSLVYEIQRQPGDKNAIANRVTRLPTSDWMAEGVLRFLGESWTP
ncbi:hypothetical protein B0H13DRAFT_2553228 [Mycena leptocephala]|nr:hypothetical protein B0H13DRAFT_2553228 [Mycena leptocephala]